MRVEKKIWKHATSELDKMSDARWFVGDENDFYSLRNSVRGNMIKEHTSAVTEVSDANTSIVL